MGRLNYVHCHQGQSSGHEHNDRARDTTRARVPLQFYGTSYFFVGITLVGHCGTCTLFIIRNLSRKHAWFTKDVHSASMQGARDGKLLTRGTESDRYLL